MKYFRGYVLIVLMMGMGLSSAWAQRSGEMPKQFEGVELKQKLGEQVPLNLTFQNEEGETVRLKQYAEKDKPIFLTLVYHNCPMLCGLMLNKVTGTMKQLAWTPGQQYEAVTVSFNHRETPEIARRKKQKYLKELDKPGAASGWHFLTGSKENIKKLADAVGFDFRWISEEEQYAHPAALMFLSPDGTISRYLTNWSAPPGDMRKALVEASNGEVGNVVDKALMYCFQYDPSSNSYVANAFNIMKAGGILTVIVLGIMLFYFWRREREQLDEVTAESMTEGSGPEWEAELSRREA